MCQKCNPKHLNNNHADLCMKKICDLINKYTFVTCLSSCCGHGIYPMTIIVRDGNRDIFEWFSRIQIPRKRNFYKRDKQGIFFIKELNEGDQK